jgi:hypothetical protein
MRDYSILHLNITSSKGTAHKCMAVLHFTVTIRSSTMNKTHTLKWVWNSLWCRGHPVTDNLIQEQITTISLFSNSTGLKNYPIEISLDMQLQKILNFNCMPYRWCYGYCTFLHSPRVRYIVGSISGWVIKRI